VRKDHARVSKAARSKTPIAPPDIDPLSICATCAKHPSLKRFVKESGAPGYQCGICLRSDLIASAPAKHEALSYLIRALVRFYYNDERETQPPRLGVRLLPDSALEVSAGPSSDTGSQATLQPRFNTWT
jgi:hypothetical protein